MHVLQSCPPLSIYSGNFDLFFVDFRADWSTAFFTTSEPLLVFLYGYEKPDMVVCAKLCQFCANPERQRHSTPQDTLLFSIPCQNEWKLCDPNSRLIHFFYTGLKNVLWYCIHHLGIMWEKGHNPSLLLNILTYLGYPLYLSKI